MIYEVENILNSELVSKTANYEEPLLHNFSDFERLSAVNKKILKESTGHCFDFCSKIIFRLEKGGFKTQVSDIEDLFSSKTLSQVVEVYIAKTKHINMSFRKEGIETFCKRLNQKEVQPFDFENGLVLGSSFDSSNLSSVTIKMSRKKFFNTEVFSKRGYLWSNASTEAQSFFEKFAKEVKTDFRYFLMFLLLCHNKQTDPGAFLNDWGSWMSPHWFINNCYKHNKKVQKLQSLVLDQKESIGLKSFLNDLKVLQLEIAFCRNNYITAKAKNRLDIIIGQIMSLSLKFYKLATSPWMHSLNENDLERVKVASNVSMKLVRQISTELELNYREVMESI